MKPEADAKPQRIFHQEHFTSESRAANAHQFGFRSLRLGRRSRGKRPLGSGAWLWPDFDDHSVASLLCSDDYLRHIAEAKIDFVPLVLRGLQVQYDGTLGGDRLAVEPKEHLALRETFGMP